MLCEKRRTFTIFASLALCLVASSADAAGINVTVKIGLCGDGVIDTTEECDGTALGAHTCTTEGFGGGTLSCMPSCELDTSGCSAAAPATSQNNGGSASGVPADAVAASPSEETSNASVLFALATALTNAIDELQKRVFVPIALKPAATAATAESASRASSRNTSPPQETRPSGAPQGTAASPPSHAPTSPARTAAALRTISNELTKIMHRLQNVGQTMWQRFLIRPVQTLEQALQLDIRGQVSAAFAPIAATIQPLPENSGETGTYQNFALRTARYVVSIIRTLTFFSFP